MVIAEHAGGGHEQGRVFGNTKGISRGLWLIVDWSDRDRDLKRLRDGSRGSGVGQHDAQAIGPVVIRVALIAEAAQGRVEGLLRSRHAEGELGIAAGNNDSVRGVHFEKAIDHPQAQPAVEAGKAAQLDATQRQTHIFGHAQRPGAA